MNGCSVGDQSRSVSETGFDGDWEISDASIMSTVLNATDTELDAMIQRSPGILGGKPSLHGHRIGVHRVAGWWRAGLSIEEIGERLSGLTPAEIHVALAYYHLHRPEIDGYLEEERAACERLERLAATPPRAG